MLTEAEAKTKWCPMVRVPLSVDDDAGICIPGNRAEYSNSGPLPRGTLCIASACMAWRFAGWVNLTADGSLELADDRHGPFLMSHGPTKNEHGCVRIGHCGAFGKS